MTQYNLKLTLGSSVRSTEWFNLQKQNANNFESSIILTDGFDSDFYNYKREKENYFMASTCRNLVIDEFLKTDSTHLVWLDEDLKLDERNYILLLQTIQTHPTDVILCERTYKSGMKDIRIKKERFNNYVNYRFAYCCFIVLPRDLLELETEWFSEYFNGCWGYEDTAYAYKCMKNGYKFFVSNAKAECMGVERYTEQPFDDFVWRSDETKWRQMLSNKHKFNGYRKYLDKQFNKKEG